jgi:hypothetical protein
MSIPSSLRWLLLPLLALPVASGNSAPAPARMPTTGSTPDAPAAQVAVPTPVAAAAVPAQRSEAALPQTWAGSAWPWQRESTFAQLGRRQDTLLSGVRNATTFEFQVRRDRLAREAELDLSFTPSPSLLPTLSHLRVYLNDALMGVVPISNDQLGRPVQAKLPLDARLIADFNQVRLEFVGHYTDICEEPTHSSLWVNLSSNSTLRLGGQLLAMQDDLANFPLPFFDTRDTARLELPVVFGAAPTLAQQRAGAVMAS